jgi:arginyl-tRNA synthetase
MTFNTTKAFNPFYNKAPLLHAGNEGRVDVRLTPIQAKAILLKKGGFYVTSITYPMTMEQREST